MSQSTTLKSISSLLNISVSTVSRALKNHPDISDKTKKKVQELAAMMDYEPNAHAISLRTNTSKLLGLIVPALSNFFYTSFLTALEEESRKHGYTLITLQSGDNTNIEQENLKLCRINHIAGLFIAISPETKNIDSFLRMEKNGVPVIFFDKVPDAENCNKVRMADEEAAIMAAEVIQKSKRKKILALFGNQEFSITKKRWKSFTGYFEKNAPATEVISVFVSSTQEAITETEKEMKQHEPDAVFCMSDEILAGAMKSIKKLKINVPKKVAVIAISNGFIPQLFDPEITYVETSGMELGKLAFNRMINYFNGQTTSQELIVPSKYVKGGSI
ncbi:MAG: LacI family transcriptional regulator [Sphingobacteriales bacterium]|nr:MAG: LacI family transcriptional regulator [Sphingobacteriales bacterium]